MATLNDKTINYIMFHSNYVYLWQLMDALTSAISSRDLALLEVPLYILRTICYELLQSTLQCTVAECPSLSNYTLTTNYLYRQPFSVPWPIVLLYPVIIWLRTNYYELITTNSLLRTIYTGNPSAYRVRLSCFIRSYFDYELITTN